MEGKNLDTGLVSGPGSACTSELVSKEMMLTRVYLIWGSVLGSLDVTAGEVLLAETSLGGHSSGAGACSRAGPLGHFHGYAANF